MTVNTTNDVDDGTCNTSHCSLREALNAANANGATADVIDFSVTGTISPATALPALASGNTTIAGVNQQITIDGSGLPGWWTACLHLTSNSNTVKGLVIANCAGHGIQIDGGWNVIGGTTASERNVIRDYSQAGIWGSGPAVTGNQILGNDIAGNPAWEGDWQGIVLGYGASGNTVGGSSPGARNVMTGGQVGVWLPGAGPNNVIQGNYMGVDATGSSAAPNGSGVVMDEGASGNSVLDNVISGNDGEGVRVGGLFYVLSGSNTDFWAPIDLDGHIDVSVGWQWASQDDDGGQVLSWFFSTNKGYQLDISLTQVGATCSSGPVWLTHIGSDEKVQVTPGYSGACPGDGQVFFSWSQPIGIPVAPYGSAANNVIQGNKIGTNAAGTAAVPNGSEGVRVMGTSGNTQIGGPNPGDGNLISGNLRVGASIHGGSANDVVQGNLIGTDVSGAAPLPNGGGGVELGSLYDYQGTVGTTVRSNVISGNQGNGLTLSFGTGFAQVMGNRIGTNAAGNAALPNGNSGVNIFLGSHDNTIGGPTPGQRNVISGNNGPGLEMWWDAQNNNVIGNYIGLSAGGSAPIPNGWMGVGMHDRAIDNSVTGNVISGNSNGAGVSIGEFQYVLSSSPGDFFAPISLTGHIRAVRRDSVFEADDSGGAIGTIFFRALPGDELQIEVCGDLGPVWLTHLASGESVLVTVGGSGCPLNVSHTIVAGSDYGPSTGNVVQDNYIGTDPGGNSALPNSEGLQLLGESGNNLVGGPGHGNVISGNAYQGIRIMGGSWNDVIQGNRIGVNAAGNAPLGNGHNGIYFDEWGAGLGTVIGGPGPGEGNVIGASGMNGVDISNGAHLVVVQGNFIGTNATGTDLGNGHQGVIAHAGAHDNFIGGPNPGERNVIAFNTYSGVGVFDHGSVHNTIRGNSIYSNGHWGIANWDGGNLELPPPIVTSVGPLTGTACLNCMVDVYSDNGEEGRIYEGSTITGPGGSFTFPGVIHGPNVTTTATDSPGNTSRFSDPYTVPGANVVSVDVKPDWGGVEPFFTAVIGPTFDIDVDVTGTQVPYAGYNSVLKFDPEVLAFDGHSYQAAGQFDGCASPTTGADRVKSGCFGFSPITYTGPTDRMTFHCLAEGGSPLHLVAPGEAGIFTTTLGVAGTEIPTALFDGWVWCQPCFDRDGDTSCDDPVNDPDDDGCTTAEEAALGSVFDPTYDGWYDVYDVPVPAKPDADGANGKRDRVVDIRDVLAVLFYAFAEPSGACGDNPNSNGVDYDCVKGMDLDGDSTDDVGTSHNIMEGLKYDRHAGVGPDPVTGIYPAGPPDNVVDIRDVLATLAQAFVVDCSEAP